MAAPQRVRADEADHLAVVETHLVEDPAHVRRGARAGVVVIVGARRLDRVVEAVGEHVLRRAGRLVRRVGAAARERDHGAAHVLDRGVGRQDPEVGVGDGRELGLDGLQEVPSDAEAARSGAR